MYLPLRVQAHSTVLSGWIDDSFYLEMLAEVLDHPGHPAPSTKALTLLKFMLKSYRDHTIRLFGHRHERSPIHGGISRLAKLLFHSGCLGELQAGPSSFHTLHMHLRFGPQELPPTELIGELCGEDGVLTLPRPDNPFLPFYGPLCCGCLMDHPKPVSVELHTHQLKKPRYQRRRVLLWDEGIYISQTQNLRCRISAIHHHIQARGIRRGV